MKPRDSQEYKEWFAKADHDLEGARLLFKHGDFMDTVGYHLHQTIEKYLKGFLLFHNYDYPITHNLIKLLAKCANFDKDIKNYEEECERMNAYYIEAKYPMDAPQDYPKEEMNKSIEMTQFLIKYIKRAVQKEK